MIKQLKKCCLKNFIFLLFVRPILADTCLNSGKLAGLIFGSIFGTLVICLSIAMFILFLSRKHKKAEKVLILERAHATIETDSNFSSEPSEVGKLEKGIGTDRVSIRRHTSLRDNQMITDLKMADVEERTSSGIASDEGTRSIDSLYQSMKDIGNMNKCTSNKITKLGFSISPNDIEGIKILEVEKNGPASQSGNIFEGDCIKNLTISFENMLYEDAVKLLHYSSPYLIKLNLERTSPLNNMENDTSISESFTINISPKTTTPEEKNHIIEKNSETTSNCTHEVKAVDSIIQNNCVIISGNIEKEIIIDTPQLVNHIERSESSSSATTVSSTEFNDAENSVVIEFAKVQQIDSKIIPSKMEIIEQKDESIKKTKIPQRSTSIKSRPPSPSRLPTPTKSPRRLTDTNIRISRTPSISEQTQNKTFPDTASITSTPEKISLTKSLSTNSSEINSILNSEEVPLKENLNIEEKSMPNNSPPKNDTLLPEIKLLKAKTIKRLDTPPHIPIVERELPPLPISNTSLINDKNNEEIVTSPGKMYLEIKEKLRNVYKDPISPIDNDKEKLQCNEKNEINKKYCQELLEKNKKIIEEQREELRSLGFNVN
ncbi:PDZ domain-containing protein [Strongyloides ratti]|uniref:PDZ domain-containing protein n=1 Tax=Strongyloides ratti TaxID=34506 RepID=A0A090KZI9_STRRB|nr:PDZ domain-containing protein [Strongyloides ratti]CEF62950.1 PDZ domain-containing protein [Strongyloides ratti]